jgi:peptide/nickel transport system permease protein
MTLRVLSRLAQMVIVGVVVVVLTFALLHLVPGNPALTILGPRATPQTVAALTQHLHLNRPLPEQFWLYIRSLSEGDLGRSITAAQQPVSGIVFQSLGVTLSLIALTVILSCVLGVCFGVISGMQRGRAPDIGIRSVSIVLLAMPPFVIGFLLLLFALKVGVPVGGWGTGPLDDLKYLWLPALALSAYLAPLCVRAIRQSVQDTLGQQFIEGVIARGLPMRRLVVNHVVPNSLLPVISLVGYNIGALIGGAVVVEVVFDLPGIGTALVNAVANRDYPVVQGIALVTAIIVIIVNGVTDVLYEIVDPRTRVRR